jgi:hypothetical protein
LRFAHCPYRDGRFFGKKNKVTFAILGDIRDSETIATGQGVDIRRDQNACMAKAAGAKEKEKQRCNLQMGQFAKPRSIGLKRTESGGRISKSREYSDE